MTTQGLTQLHVVPQNQPVNTGYHVSKVLEGSLLAAVDCKAENGNVAEKKIMPERSQKIFTQDGATTPTSKRSSHWCTKHLPGSWEKGVRSGNSSDLNPIENLPFIMKQRLDEEEPTTNLRQLESRRKKAWHQISTRALHSLVASIPSRVRKGVNLHNEYLGG